MRLHAEAAVRTRIMRFAVLFAAALALPLSACGKSTCQKYADMEVKCGEYPAAEKDMTHDLAQGFCMAADSDNDPAAKEMSEHFKAEAKCAEKTSDCAEYRDCVAAVP